MTADEIKAALIKAEPGVNRRLDSEIWKFLTEAPGQRWVWWSGEWRIMINAPAIKYLGSPFRYTSDLSAAASMIPEDFFFTCGRCALSGHVTIGPDYNGPHRKRLLREWPEGAFIDGFSADLDPGGSVERVCHAICYAVIEMTEAKRRLGL